MNGSLSKLLSAANPASGISAQASIENSGEMGMFCWMYGATIEEHGKWEEYPKIQESWLIFW